MGKLRYIFARAFMKLKPNAIIKSRIDKTANVGHGNQLVDCTIGRYTYLGNRCSIVYVNIGNFCSISGDVIIGGAAHPLDNVSTSPVFHKGRNALRVNFSEHDFNPYEETIIGNDVWIAHGCKIKGGIRIGNGAVVGMGSVVTKDVPDYAIVAGNPAKIIRYRFDEDTVQFLNEIRWWEYDEKKLRDYAQYFNNCEELKKRYVK